MISNWQEIVLLLRKDMQLELRRKQVLLGYLIYMLSTVFLIHSLEDNMSSRMWNAVFWLVILFVTVILASKAFLGESPHRQQFYFQNFRPKSVIISKQIYSMILSLIFVLLAYGALSFFDPLQLAEPGKYFLALLMGTFCIAACITFLSSMASQLDDASGSLTAVMGLPLMIPLFLLIRQSTLGLVSDVTMTGWGNSVGLLSVYLVLIWILSVLLFPMVWND